MREAAAKEGYESASEDLLVQAGLNIEGRQIQRLVNLVAPQVAEQLEQGQDSHHGPIPIFYAEVDGTGVPMVAEELKGRPGKQADGSSKTREVKLGAIFTQTKTDEEGLPVRDDASTTFVGSFQAAVDFGGARAPGSAAPRTGPGLESGFYWRRSGMDLGTGPGQLSLGDSDPGPLSRGGTPR